MQEPRFERKRAETCMMNMACHFNNRRHKPHAHHKTHLHTMKVCNTRPDCFPIELLLMRILLFFDD